MDTYPRLAKELDLAWAPDKSRIVAYSCSEILSGAGESKST